MQNNRKNLTRTNNCVFNLRTSTDCSRSSSTGWTAHMKVRTLANQAIYAQRESVNSEQWEAVQLSAGFFPVWWSDHFTTPLNCAWCVEVFHVVLKVNIVSRPNILRQSMTCAAILYMCIFCKTDNCGYALASCGCLAGSHIAAQTTATRCVLLVTNMQRHQARQTAYCSEIQEQ